MLATEWCIPGEGSTVKELLDWAPSYVIEPAEFRRLAPYMNQKTSLRLAHPKDGGAYDIERIHEALCRMFREPELCVTLLHNDHGEIIEHVHFGGNAQMPHGDLKDWIMAAEFAWGHEAGPLSISMNCFEVEHVIQRMEDKHDN